MSSYSHWYGAAERRVDASNQHQMRTYQATCDYSNPAGERRRCVFTTNLVYYSFTMSLMQCGNPLAASHFGRVCAGCITCEASASQRPGLGQNGRATIGQTEGSRMPSSPPN